MDDTVKSMLCTCIGIFLIVIAGFLAWSLFYPRGDAGPRVSMAAGGSSFLEIPSSNALAASSAAPVLLVSAQCGHCINAKKQMQQNGTAGNVLVSAASAEHFKQVPQLAGVPALIKDKAIVAMGASPELHKHIASADPKAAQAAYDKHK